MDKSYSRLIIKLYAYSFFDDFILIYPLYAVMFADAHLTPSRISILFIVWSLTAFLLEIPAGSLADKYPRKNILLLGILLRVIGYGFWLFSKTFTSFLIGFIFWGIKGAFSSGTEEALVYDELNRIGQPTLYAKVMGRIEAYALLGVVVAGVGASALARHGYGLVLILSIASVLISGLAVYLLPTAKAVKASEEAKYLEYFKEGISEVFKKSIILYLIIFMSVVAGLGAIDEYFTLFFRQKGFTNSSLALWFAFIYGLGALGSIVAHRFENKKLPANFFLFVWATLLWLAAISPKLVVPILLGLYLMFFFGAQVLFNSYLQKHLNDKTRATATSVGGFTAELFAILSFAVVGFGANHSGYIYSFKLIAGCLVMFGLILYLYSRRANLTFSGQQ